MINNNKMSSKQALIERLKAITNKKGKPLLKVSNRNSIEELRKFDKTYLKMLEEYNFNPSNTKLSNLTIGELRDEYKVYKKYTTFTKDQKYYRQGNVSIFPERPENIEFGFIKSYEKEADKAIQNGLNLKKFSRNITYNYLKNFNENLKWKYRITYKMYGSAPEEREEKKEEKKEEEKKEQRKRRIIRRKRRNENEYISYLGKQYEELTQEPYYEFCETIFDISSMYPANTLKQIYKDSTEEEKERNDYEPEFTYEFKDFLHHIYLKDRNYPTEYSDVLQRENGSVIPELILNSLPGSKSRNPELIKIISIERSLDINALTQSINIKEVKIYDETQPKIYSKYINYGYDYKSSKEDFSKLFHPII